MIRGWQRAGAWAALFGSGSSDDYPRPDAVYAATPAPIAKGAKYSRRPFETAEPLAHRLGLKVVTTWASARSET